MRRANSSHYRREAGWLSMLPSELRPGALACQLPGLEHAPAAPARSRCSPPRMPGPSPLPGAQQVRLKRPGISDEPVFSFPLLLDLHHPLSPPLSVSRTHQVVGNFQSRITPATLQLLEVQLDLIARAVAQILHARASRIRKNAIPFRVAIFGHAAGGRGLTRSCMTRLSTWDTPSRCRLCECWSIMAS